MSFPVSTIEAIQRAGAAVFEADSQLKGLTQDYAQRVHAAVLANPYHLGNDSLFDHWKTVARMSQTLSSMEEELRKIYQLAGDIGEDQDTAAAVPVLAAPAQVLPVEVVQQLNVTDVRIKKPRKKTPHKSSRQRAGAEARTAASAHPTTSARSSARRSPPATAANGNAARLLAYFERILDARRYLPVNQTAASKATGIPLGSMSAAMRKLLNEQHLLAGPSGQFKLGR